MLKFFVFACVGLFAADLWASGCPDLSGRYKHPFVGDPADITSYMDVYQKGCESIAISYCKLDQAGTATCPSWGWSGGLLNGTAACEPYQTTGCPFYSYTPSAIVTDFFPSVALHDHLHGICDGYSYSWSHDGHGNIVESRPVRCTDGFKGNLTRTFEKF